jgi:ABC-type phosphate/phosphonate transport system substrate-binding protein
MYDLAELADANAAFLRALRQRLLARGVDVGGRHSDATTRHDPERLGPNVLFTQMCGYPLFKYCRDEGDVLATPCYEMAGCDGPYHRSFFIVRADDHAAHLDDLRGRVFGCNSLRSNTGMNLPRLSLARIADRKPFFSRVVVTGSHLQSLEQLGAGSIDLCAIDCVTWGFLARFRPALTARGRILAETVSSPSLPFVTAATTNGPAKAALRHALVEIFAEPRYLAVRDALALCGVAHLESAAYEQVLHHERQAAALGYPVLR